MQISLVVAKSENDVIGVDNQLPWHLPADMKHFKTVTMGKPIVMGRKTFESIGEALPGRRNVVVSRQESLTIPDCEVFHSLNEAFSALASETEVMVIGGAHIFEQTLAHANQIYMTIVEDEFEGDTYFPALDESDWKLSAEEKYEADEKNPHDYSFQLWRRVAKH